MSVQLVTGGPVSFEPEGSPGVPASLALWPNGSEPTWQATSSLHLDHSGIGSVALGVAQVKELVIRADAGASGPSPLRATLAGARATKVRLAIGNGSTPEALTAIADQVAGLKELTVHRCSSPSTVSVAAMGGSKTLQLTDLWRCPIQYLPPGLLSGAAALLSVALPAELTQVAAGSFNGTAIKTIDLRASAGLTELGTGAVAGASELTSLLLPPGLARINASALSGAVFLAELDLRHTQLTRLQNRSLQGATGLSTLMLGSSITTVEPGALSGTQALAMLDLSATSVTELLPGLCIGASGLSSLLLPAPLAMIHQGAFTLCSRVRTLDLSGTQVQALPEGMLVGMANLTQLAVPPGLREIGERALSGAPLLPSIDLSRTAVTSFPSLAVSDLPALESLLLPTGITELPVGSFSNLVSLRELDLAVTKLAVLEAGALAELGGIVNLRIGSPWLQSVGDGCHALEGLTRLQTLTVMPSPQLAGLGAPGSLPPGGIASCSFAGSIKSLSLSGVNLSSLVLERDTLGAAGGTLQTVSIRGSGLRDLRTGALTSLRLLQSLDLSMNRIVVLPRLSRAVLEAIDSINATGNPLDEVAADAFAGLLNLRKVEAEVGKACNPGTVRQAVQLKGDAVAMCVKCLQGKFCPDGATAEPCPIGTYGPLEGLNSLAGCIACPEGSTTLAVGESAAEACVPVVANCAAGTGGSMCTPCAAGLASSGGREAACEACAPGSVSAALLGSIDCAAQAVELPGRLADLLGQLPTGDAPVSLAAEQSPSPQPAASESNAGRGGSRRELQEGGTSATDASSVDTEQLSGVEVLAATLQVSLGISAAAVVVLLGLMLVFPCARTCMWPVLAAVDGFRVAHAQPRFAAVRVVPTVTGGVFTLAAAVAALALASALVVGYFGANTLRSSSLKVEATGVENAHLAASATGDILFDAVFQPMRTVACPNAAELLVDSPSGDVTPIATSASTSVLQQASTGPVCWTRGKCTNCQFQSAAVLLLRAHWSVQTVAWRLASTDAEGVWVSVNGLVSPASEASIATLANTSRMLERHSESLAFVPHVAVDETPTGGMLGRSASSSSATETASGAKGRVSTGLIPQDLSRKSTSRTSEADVNPSVARAELRLSVERSAVFSDLRISQISSETQLISAVAGIVVGVLGAFASGFRMFEAHCGERLVWMCGPTGRIATEEAALGRARGKPLEPLMETGKPSIPASAASLSRLNLHRGSDPSPNPLMSLSVLAECPKRTRPGNKADSKTTP